MSFGVAFTSRSAERIRDALTLARMLFMLILICESDSSVPFFDKPLGIADLLRFSAMPFAQSSVIRAYRALHACGLSKHPLYPTRLSHCIRLEATDLMKASNPLTSTTFAASRVAVFAGLHHVDGLVDVGNGFRQDWPDCAHDALAAADRIAGFDKVHEVGARSSEYFSNFPAFVVRRLLNRPDPGTMFPMPVGRHVDRDNARDAMLQEVGDIDPERLDKPRMTISLIVPVIA